MDENGITMKILKEWIAQQKGKKQYARGLELMLAGRQEKALAEFKKIIEKNDKFFDAYVGRAIVYFEMERWEDGINDLNYVIDTLPKMAAAYYWRCTGYMGLGKMASALSDINKAIDLDKNEPANYIRRGAIYFGMGKYDLAIEDTTKSIQLGFVEDGYNNRAIYFEGIGDYMSAISDWSVLINISPKNAIAYCRRGLLWKKVGNLQEAISDINAGLRIHDGLPLKLIEECEKILNMQSRKSK